MSPRASALANDNTASVLIMSFIDGSAAGKLADFTYQMCSCTSFTGVDIHIKLASSIAPGGIWITLAVFDFKHQNGPPPF